MDFFTPKPEVEVSVGVVVDTANSLLDLADQLINKLEDYVEDDEVEDDEDDCPCVDCVNRRAAEKESRLHDDHMDYESWGGVTGVRFGHPMFYELLDKMAEIHSKKNQDYGNGNPLGNFASSLDLGIDPFFSVLVRMSDKWARICSLSKNGGIGVVKDESIEDTLIDMANYALLAIVIRREEIERDGK